MAFRDTQGPQSSAILQEALERELKGPQLRTLVSSIAPFCAFLWLCSGCVGCSGRLDLGCASQLASWRSLKRSAAKWRDVAQLDAL